MRWKVVSGVMAVWLPAFAALGQETGRVTGTVTGVEDGRPLAGAHIEIPVLRVGSVSDADGRYTIGAVTPGTYRVRASLIGYAPRTAEAIVVTAGGTATADFRLAKQAISLEQVVVTGYGETSKRDLTGSIAHVTGEDLTAKAVPTSAISNALQGKAPGVQVTTNSGTPGAGSSVHIRGSNSISANSEPLYVIDGIPATQGTTSHDPTYNPLNSFDPSDIEAIDILKDAAATAIYGARGANGVVLVTTKRGARGTDQTILETSWGTETISKTINPLTGPEYRALRNESYVNAGRTTLPYTDAQIASAETYNYPELMTRRATQQSQSLSFSGGDDRTRYLASGNYMRQNGILVASEFNRYGARANLDREMTPRLHMGTSLSVTRSEQGLNRTDNGGIGAGANGILAAMNFDPSLPPRDPVTGAWNMRATLGEQLENPLANALEVKNPRRVTRLLGDVFGEYALLESLKFKSTFGANLGFERTPQYNPRTSPTGIGDQGRASIYSNQGVELTSENTVNYRRVVAGNGLDLLGGFSVQTSHFEDQYNEGKGFPNDAFTFNNLGIAAKRTGSGSFASDAGLLSYLSRANYNVADRYLFTVTGRYDGSSRFGANNKWAFFPSAAFAWRAIDESFMKDQRLFSDLKMRISYGVTGNQAIDQYQSLDRLDPTFVAIGVNSEAVTLAPSGGRANPDLRWETQRQFNVGLDAGFFTNRMTVSIDAYRSRTNDLLLRVPLPRISGYDSQLRNVGSVENRGLELALTTINVAGDRFSWRSTLNVAANRNRVVDLGNVSFIDPGGDRYGHFIGGQSSHIVKVGEPLGTFYGYIVDGLYQQGTPCDLKPTTPGVTPAACAPGEYHVRDVNGDGKIDQNDRTVLGNAQPKWFGGFSNNMSMGAFTLDAFFNFSYGNKVANMGRVFTELATGFLNEDERVRNRWRPDNTNTMVPRANNARPRLLYSTLVEDGSFLRLQALTLGYQLPKTALFNANRARLYVTGQNLFVITHYTGYDPEVNSIGGDARFPGVDLGAFPRARTWNFGLNLGL